MGRGELFQGQLTLDIGLFQSTPPIRLDEKNGGGNLGNLRRSKAYISDPELSKMRNHLTRLRTEGEGTTAGA